MPSLYDPSLDAGSGWNSTRQLFTFRVRPWFSTSPRFALMAMANVVMTRPQRREAHVPEVGGT
ncbi:MAG TPA: hypothetical protein VNL70_08570 [Tepidisphaeraceae bacterium]|nr:hypothetical protein [Tepidisphaeraceae bacterium]